MKPILNFTGRALRPDERKAGAIELAPLAEQDVREFLRGDQTTQRAAQLAGIAAEIQAARGEPCRVLLGARGRWRRLIEYHLGLAGIAVYRPRAKRTPGRPKGTGTGRKGKPINLYLPPATVARAKEIGGGSASAGIQIAIDAMRDR